MRLCRVYGVNRACCMHYWLISIVAYTSKDNDMNRHSVFMLVYDRYSTRYDVIYGWK